MGLIDFSVSETVLLTGAGFTHNFGGFLATGMWAEIHNNFLRHYSSPDNSRMIEEIKNKFNYEDLYQSIGDSNEYTPEQIAAFIDAVYNAYDTLGEIIRNYKNKIRSKTDDINISDLSKFLQRLKGSDREHGFFFTLNQDIFIELFFTEGPNGPVCPAIKTDSRFNTGADKELDATDLRIVPKDQELEKMKMAFKKGRERLHYVKLHGSYDWRNEKNKKKMIIGTNKPGQIEKEPLLSWYFQLFKEVLSLDARRLLIIGYGFGDSHINEVIIDAIKRHNLKIYLIKPGNPANFKEKMDNIDIAVWKATYPYPHLLKEIFPRVGISPIYENLKKAFFN